MMAWLFTIIIGIALWTATAHFGGRREPWDSELYWSTAYPIAIALSGLFGFAFPERPWRWAATLIFTQLPVMFVGGSDFSLLPPGLLLLALLTLPAALIAHIAASFRRRIGA